MKLNKLERAYDGGWRAFQSGVSITHNPYAASSEESKEWSAGWEDAAQEDDYDEDEYREKDD